MLVRSIKPCNVKARRSVGCQPASAPLRLPIGVRTVSTITASRISMFCSLGGSAGAVHHGTNLTFVSAYDPGMDRADLELVVAIARAGSLSRAARELHIAQPPLSRRLQHLEREVGAALFLRGRHGATPTAVGRTLIVGAEAALAAIARAEQDALDAAAGRAGRLRIG